MGTSPGTVGLIGLGQMGRPIALTLMSKGWQVIAWDLAAASMEQLRVEGAVIARDPAHLAEQTPIVITSLPDGDAVRAVAFGDRGITSTGRRDILLVDTSTTLPADARALAAELEPFGVAFLDAPVSGGRSGAAAGTLSVMVGGSAEDLDRARPVLESMGRAVVHCGPVGAGQMAKACNQLIVMAALGAVAEALVLAKSAGLDPVQIREALMGGYAASPILDIQGDKMIRHDFTPGGKTSLSLKDIATIREMASIPELQLPVFEAAAGQMLRLIGAGGADLDNSAVVTVVEGSAKRR